MWLVITILICIICVLLVERLALRKTGKLLKVKLEEIGQMPTGEEIETFVRSEIKNLFKLK